MTDKTTVEITKPTHLRVIGEWYGISTVVDALEKVEAGAKLPGFGLALAVAQRVLAEKKADMLTLNLRVIASAGIDVATMKSVTLDYSGGKPVLVVTPMDLADLAEGL